MNASGLSFVGNRGEQKASTGLMNRGGDRLGDIAQSITGVAEWARLTSEGVTRSSAGGRRAGPDVGRADQPRGDVPKLARMDAHPGPDDAGFTMLETLVSLGLICTLMAALAPFFSDSILVLGSQSGRQVAIQVAADAMERVRSLNGAGLLEGRSLPAVQQQWHDSPQTVKDAYGAAMLCAGDPKLSTASVAACGSALTATGDSGAQAALPTQPVPVAVGGVTYGENWYVGECWRSAAADAACDVSFLPVPSPVPLPVPLPVPAADVLFLRVVVAVTWSHRSCPRGSCTYLDSTLVSPVADPVFDTYRLPPVLTNPGAQNSRTNQAASLAVALTDGEPPITWAVTGLPPGLSATPTVTGATVSGTPTSTGTYPVTAKITDNQGRTATTAFSWVVSP
jgi:type II secretory pathway pseudopilin PulG